VDGSHAAASLALADQLPLLTIVKRGWSRFPVRRTYIRIPGFSFFTFLKTDLGKICIWRILDAR